MRVCRSTSDAIGTRAGRSTEAYASSLRDAALLATGFLLLADTDAARAQNKRAVSKSSPEWAAQSTSYHQCISTCSSDSACMVRCARLLPPGRDAPSAAASGHGTPSRPGISYQNCISDECSALNTGCYRDHLASACEANSACMNRCARVTRKSKKQVRQNRRLIFPSARTLARGKLDEAK
jgi:hypothetical protein